RTALGERRCAPVDSPVVIGAEFRLTVSNRQYFRPLVCIRRVLDQVHIGTIPTVWCRCTDQSHGSIRSRVSRWSEHKFSRSIIEPNEIGARNRDRNIRPICRPVTRWKACRAPVNTPVSGLSELYF